MSHEPGRDGNPSVSLDLTMEARRICELEIKAKACCPSCVSPLQPYSLICSICGHLVVGESPLSHGQWSYVVEDSSGYMSDDISEIGDPPDVTCNDLSDDESDCEYSDEDSVSSTESYDDFIRRRAQAVLAAKEAQINLKFARKRAEIEYKLIDMEKEAQLLQLKVDTMDEIFKQTGCVKIRSKPLDSVSDTQRRKVFDTHPSVEVKETVVEQTTTDCAMDQISDPSVAFHGDILSSVNPVAPPGDSKIAGLTAGSLVIINHLQRKVIDLETELYGSSTESEDGEFSVTGSLAHIQAEAIAIIEHLQAKIVSLQGALEWKKTSELNFKETVSGSEMDSGYESQSSCGDFDWQIDSSIVRMDLQPSGGESGHMKPPSGESLCMEPSDSICQPSGGEMFIADESWRFSTGCFPVGHTDFVPPSDLKNKKKLPHVKLKHSSEHGSMEIGTPTHPCEESMLLSSREGSDGKFGDLRQCRSDLLRLL